MATFLETLQAGPMLADGGMGTLLLAQGARVDQNLEELCLSEPDRVRELQLAYARAGADILLTHTFGAQALRLAEHGLDGQVVAINRAAARIARDVRESSGRDIFIAGDIGPLGRFLAPRGPVSEEEARSAFREQAAALLEGGVDLFCVETMTDVAELRQAVLAIRELSDLPVLASLTFSADGETLFGLDAAAAAEALADLPIDVLGANCAVGPTALLDVLATLRSARPDIWLSAIPNAGLPTRVDGRFQYEAGPEYFAAMVPEFLARGARIVGGCCGTTPAHIRAMRQALDKIGSDHAGNPAHREAEPSVEWGVRVSETDGSETADPGTASGLLAKIRAGQFVVSVEVDPPRGMNPDRQLAGARLAKERGADAINVADSPMARVRMGALALSTLIENRVGIETILHFTTRDRSLMGLQADLLGAHALGLRNILALTGDPPSLGESQNSSPVYDTDSVGLVQILQQFNRGQDLQGKEMGQHSSFAIAVACDPTRPDLELETERLTRKLQHGADFIMTQPIYDPMVWIRFADLYATRYGPIPAPVLIGILPLQSFRHASFLHHEVPGITLTPTALDAMKAAGKQGRQAGVSMAQDLLLDLIDAPHVQGVYLMPSFGRYETACRVLDVLDRTPTREAA